MCSRLGGLYFLTCFRMSFKTVTDTVSALLLFDLRHTGSCVWLGSSLNLLSRPCRNAEAPQIYSWAGEEEVLSSWSVGWMTGRPPRSHRALFCWAMLHKYSVLCQWKQNLSSSCLPVCLLSSLLISPLFTPLPVVEMASSTLELGTACFSLFILFFFLCWRGRTKTSR